MIVVFSAQNELDGTIMEFTNNMFIVIDSGTKLLQMNKSYTLEELKNMFGEFTYKELLFD